MWVCVQARENICFKTRCEVTQENNRKQQHGTAKSLPVTNHHLFMQRVQMSPHLRGMKFSPSLLPTPLNPLFSPAHKPYHFSWSHVRCYVMHFFIFNRLLFMQVCPDMISVSTVQSVSLHISVQVQNEHLPSGKCKKMYHYTSLCGTNS